MRGFTLGFGRVFLRCGRLWQWHGLGWFGRRYQWQWRPRPIPAEERRYTRTFLAGRIVQHIGPALPTTLCGHAGAPLWDVFLCGPFTLLICQSKPWLACPHHAPPTARTRG